MADVMAWAIPVALMIALFLAIRRWPVFQRIPPEWAVIGMAVIVGANSIHELMTADSETRRLVYAGLLGAMAMTIVFALRPRRTQ